MLRQYRIIKNSIANFLLPLILIATIPLAIYSILNSNLDTRKHAYEPEGIKNKCTIIIPYINHKSLAVDKNYQMVVHAEFDDKNIQYVEIRDTQDKILFTEQYSPSIESVLEKFSFKPEILGTHEISGFVQTPTTKYPCNLKVEPLIVVETNFPPIFLSNPYINAIPHTNNILVGEKYEYVLEASDKDGDSIHYYYSSNPRADWLHQEVINNGEYGNLQIKFSGIPEKPGVHLTTFTLHDGYNQHISSQSWVLNVVKHEGDIKDIERPQNETILLKSNFANMVRLPNPYITGITPTENSTVHNPRSLISVTLNASNDAHIIEDSISLKLNSQDLFSEINMLRISEEQIILTFSPNYDLDYGEHKVEVVFKDSNGFEFEKTWNFNLESENTNGTIFGFPLKTVTIIIAGFLLLLLSLSIPWILYIAWKKNEEKDYKENGIPT